MAADFSSVNGVGTTRNYDIKPQHREIPKQPEQYASNDNNKHTARELRQAENLGEILSVSDEQIIKAFEKAAKALESPYTSFDISVHEKTKQLVVKVLNKETGEIIREIPKEKTLDMYAKMLEVAGILVDERR